MKPPDKPLFYNLKTVTYLLGLSRTSVFKMVRNKEIESHLICGRRLFSVAYIHEKFGHLNKPHGNGEPDQRTDGKKPTPETDRDEE